MSARVNMTVTGVFPSKEQANLAMAELQQAGFESKEVSLVANRDATEEGVRGESGVTVGTGAGAGMLTGAALGGLAGSVPGMVVGGVAGAVLGTFIDLGVPEDAAAFYQGEVEAGRTVVLVRSTRATEAADLLRLHGAKEVRLSSASTGDAG